MTIGRARQDGSVTCNYCKKEGHVVRDCPTIAAFQCYKCGQKGHQAKRCPQKGLVANMRQLHQEDPEKFKKWVEEASRSPPVDKGKEVDTSASPVTSDSVPYIEEDFC